MRNVKEAYNVVFVEAQDPLRPTSTRVVEKSIVSLPVMIPMYTHSKTIPVIAHGLSLGGIKENYT